MRNFKFKSGAGLLFLASLFLASCGEQTELDQPEVTGGETVEVTKEIQINVLPIQSIGGTTRAAVDNKPEKGEAIGLTYGSDATTRVQTGSDAMTSDESKINNAYIVQFNGTSPESTIAWVSGDIKSQLSSGSAITIPASFSMTEGIKNRVYVVANVASAPATGTTLANFEKPVAYTVGTDLPTIGGSKCLPMSAMQDVGVGDTFDVFQLRSVLAKLKFTTSAGTLKLMKVPNGYSFFTQNPGDVAVRPASTTYTTTAVLTSGTTYYVPENLSGRNIGLPYHAARALGFAAPGAMYVEITNSGTTYNLLLGDGSVSDFNFVGGYSYNVKATIYGTDVRDLRIGNRIPSDSYKDPWIDLVSELNGETANCYIATEANTWYTFDATKMGNGKATPANGASDAADIVPSKLNPASVDVLWETLNTATTPTEGDIVMAYPLKDKILFKTGAKEGNAVIAARDANNNIIWSWHIWRTNAQPAAVTLADITSTSGNFAATGTTTISGLQIMDRNLGALNATAQDNGSIGLLYQWGRKDPFPGGADLANKTTVIATIPLGVPATASGGSSITVADAIQQPTTFYTNSGDWTNRNDNLWGTPLTGSVTINTKSYNSNKGSKSIYDPCPVGWRVPPAYVFANAVRNVNSGDFNKGYSFTTGDTNFTTSGSVWFPASASRDCSDGTLGSVGANGGYWASSSNEFNPLDGSRLYIDGNNVSSASRSERSSGSSCRCVKEH